MRFAVLDRANQTHQLGWGAFERGRFSSICGVFSTPGNMIVGPIVAALGLRSTATLAYVSWALQSLAFALAPTPWVYTAVSTSFVLNPLRFNVPRAAMAAHAPKVGIPQGALASATENLENFVALFSGQVWARVYAFGVARGSPALFYVIIAAVTLGQAAFVTVEMREGVAKGD